MFGTQHVKSERIDLSTDEDVAGYLMQAPKDQQLPIHKSQLIVAVAKHLNLGTCNLTNKLQF